ncbi:MAG: cupin domain-containing protein [Candidatus Puniceispirillaceae bacterium]
MISSSEMESRIVRYGDLVPCRTAFIDAHTPGSDQKENFTIIGGGVSESADQHVHIKETPGFNIGAAGQPPFCRNSLHTHRTAEVFFVLSGTWRFFWGRYGNAGEVTLTKGDIINIPTGVFRGFENIGTDYGMILAILGGDDAGGGVLWAPEVILDAKDHGLILGQNGKLYDSKKGESLPADIAPMPVMEEEVLATIKEPTVSEFIPHYVARYLDLMALSKEGPVDVISPNGVLRDKPGFAVDFISASSVSSEAYASEAHEVLMVASGHWRLSFEGGTTTLAPGDVAAIPPNLSHSLCPAMSGEASMYRVTSNHDPAGPTWTEWQTQST